jgi:hypothetical protein
MRSEVLRLLGTAFTAIVLWLGSVSPAQANSPPGSTPEAEAGPPHDLQAQKQDQSGALDLTGTVAPDQDFDKLAGIAIDKGDVRAIITLRVTFTPEGLFTPQEGLAQRANIERARAQLIDALAGTEYTVIHEYNSIPSVALLLSAEAVRALQKSGLAARVQQDMLLRPILASSGPIVESTEAAVLSRTGSGRKVAILDTGVDKDHAFIGSTQVTNEACFALGADGVAGAGDCPNGSSSQIGLGAGEDCTYSGDCAHGTHVAGIVMGGPHSSSPGGGAGVARSAKVIPVQVFSNFSGSALAWFSDTIAGLNYIFNLPAVTRNTIASVNMSLGGGLSAVACDTDAHKPAIDNLLSVGIATVIAAGNDGSNSSVSFPGCVSTAVTVGATDDADNVAGFSNSSPLVDLLAIGVGITSSVPNADPPPVGAPPYAIFNGTSMATPMVAGAFADLDQVNPAASVADHLAKLQSSGVSVTDPDNGVTKPRIRTLAASVLHKDTGFKSGGTFTGLGYDMVSNGVGLATRAGGPGSGVITISGIPAGATIRNAFLYWVTIGGADKTAVFQGVSRTGTLVGASQDTCWGFNGLTPNRVYRASLPLSSVPGNGVYSVSGVGGLFVDGQGASLVVVYSVPSSLTGKVHLRHGAMTVNISGQTMSHTFTGISLPAAPVSAHLNVGLGDGQGFSENPMLFAGSAVTPADFFPGSDGIMWDDRTIGIPLGLLPVGVTSRTNSIQTVSDCLVWSYAALAYRRP